MVKNLNKRKALLIAGGILAVAAVGSAQIKQVIKLVGVTAAVKKFGPQINTEINKLAKHEDTPKIKTRVVPIISVGINTGSAVGAAQVMGPPLLVDKVAAV